MNGRAQLLLQLFVATLLVPLNAQQDPLSTLEMEDQLYRNESAFLPEAFAASTETAPLPIDLNNSSAEELETSGRFTSYQIYQLLNYRQTYGPLYSVHELAALPGFNHSFILKNDGHFITGATGIPEVVKAGQDMILVNLERAYPLSEASAHYVGSQLKTILRIRSHPRHNLSLALSYEKDAGEDFLYQKRPQFLSGYLSYEGKRFFKQLVVGNYRLNQGAGLVNGSGFFHRIGNIRITRRSISSIQPYASITESMYEQGMACSMGIKKVQILLWASYHKFSISSSAIIKHPTTDQWLDLRRSSGFFRTEGELEARDLAYRIHSGIQLLYRSEGLSIGVLSGSEWAGPGKKIEGLLDEKPVPNSRQKLSIHGNWYKKKMQVFGELSSNEFSSLAFLLGTNYQFNDFIQGSLLIHHYGPEYRGSLPSSYSSGSDIRNEQGLAFHLHMETGKAITMKLTGEIFRYPSPRYLSLVPSGGYRLDLSLQNPPNNRLQWRSRLVSINRQTTPENEISPVRPLLNSRVDRFDCQLIHKLDDRFRWMSRLVIGYYSQMQYSSTGYAAVQQLTLNSKHIKIVGQFVLFHVDEWANRIYLYEPGFYYSFSFPVYYGSGQKTSLLLTFKPMKGLSVSTRISTVIKEGNQSWDTGIQIRIKF
jgi:hypothetical protein